MDRVVLIKKLEKLTPLHKVLILVVTVLAIGGGYWHLYLQADLDEMNALRGDIAKAEADIDQYQKIIAANLPMIEKELETRLRQFQYAKALLPEDSVEKERLLANIEKLARDEGLTFRLFQPGGEAVADFYATTNIQLDMSGEFHSLMRFFSRMSGLDRLVSLENISYTPITGSSGEILLNAKSRILLYRALSEAEIAARKEKEKAAQAQSKSKKKK
jgi:type IV pilus assembly protein PilO